MNHIAIILARGGSKRLPRKNIVEIYGKPMLAWTIEAAIQAGCYKRILVSTDDSEIANIAKEYGAEVPFLREFAADDKASSSEATIAALCQAESYWNERYDTVSQLMANCPLRGPGEINDALENFLVRQVEYQISCFKFGWMNPWWAATLSETKTPSFHFPEALESRSQDLPDLFCPTGAIWISKPESLRKSGTFYGPNHIWHPMPWVSALDIDDTEDLQMAQACFHGLVTLRSI